MENAMSMKLIIKELCPPLALRGLKSLRSRVRGARPQAASTGDEQDLDVYWDPNMAEILETWGEGNAWNEIPMFLYGLEGKVLDIACGTGKVMEINQRINPGLDLYGCDISDFLISKAQERGLPKDKLIVCDATNMSMYPDQSFDFAYSIGSLEHFTEEGIDALVRESARLVKHTCFHMMPIARSGRDEGWMKTLQSFHNNSPKWWVERFLKGFPKVTVFDSAWQDDISLGKWFVCAKR
jgi:SAM-dependent methyltransferase